MMKQNTPEISVVIATYNGQPYLADQLWSVLKQDYNDFEIILVDDCSSDETVKVASDIFAKAGFTRYTIIKNDSNLGINRTFQTGVESARGAYIAFCDQDDTWETEKLRTLLKVIRESGADVAYAPSVKMGPDGRTEGLLISPGTYRNRFRRFLQNRARGASMLVSSEFLKNILPFSVHDYYDKWIIFHALAAGRVAFCSKPLDRYRVHSGNEVGTDFKYRSRENLLAKLTSEVQFYTELEKSLGPGNPNSASVHELVTFHELLVSTMLKRKFIPSVSGYFRYVLKNRIGVKDSLVYFYYLFIR
jgi:glycosyltransferase involved in cell wall biosynthesis